ncbi:MAG: efflux RND transporter permease subunit, partial [Synergistaceae bacterium]|nr:efflux RND transporter permease subunit [Synergistaceae bacterium]
GQAVELLNKLMMQHVPADSDIKMTASGMTKAQSESFMRLAIALIVAVVLVYVIMAIQFESFLQPFAIMFSLPLLTPGAFGLLWLTGCKLDIMSYMGLILLVGIVVNNGIILIDFINQERAKGMEKIEAVVNAGPLRLRAILITALSTLIGTIPAALKLSEGSESRQPMSIAIFGGLFTSTLLTLFIVPVVYLVLEGLKEKLYVKFGRVDFLGLAKKKLEYIKGRKSETI